MVKLAKNLVILAMVVYFLVASVFSMPLDNFVSNLHEDEALPEANISDNPPPPGNPHPALIRLVHAGRGFALGPDDEPHLLSVVVEKTRDLQPSLARKFLRENKSIEEIMEKITKDDEAFVNRGYIRLDGTHYKLVDINLTLEDTRTTLEANVTELQKMKNVMVTDGDDEPIGNIKIETTGQEGGWIGEGELVMDQGRYRGNYTVLLDMSYP